MHLDSIFDGFQKLISGPDERHESRKMPFVIEKTIHNILFIKTHMQRQDEFDAVSWVIISSKFPFYTRGSEQCNVAFVVEKRFMILLKMS